MRNAPIPIKSWVYAPTTHARQAQKTRSYTLKMKNVARKSVQGAVGMNGHRGASVQVSSPLAQA